MLPTTNDLASYQQHHLLELFIGYQKSPSLFLFVIFVDSYVWWEIWGYVITCILGHIISVLPLLRDWFLGPGISGDSKW